MKITVAEWDDANYPCKVKMVDEIQFKSAVLTEYFLSLAEKIMHGLNGVEV